METKKLVLGPILGHTSDNYLTVWGRAAPSPGRISFLVGRLLKDGQVLDIAHSQWPVWDSNDGFDGAGIIKLNIPADAFNSSDIGLTYQLLSVDLLPDEDITDSHEPNWELASLGSVNSSHAGNENISFLLGSCRHMGVYDSSEGDQQNPKQGDRTFKNIVTKHIDRIDFNLFTGDQVYADHDDGVSIEVNKGATDKQKYYEKYMQAYSQQYFSELVRNRPTYMILDDHELWNSYNRYSPEPKYNDPERFRAGMTAYLAHQGILSTNEYKPTVLDEIEYPSLYYKFSKGNYRYFVMDLRTTRNEEAEPEAEMIDEAQEDALREWISENHDHPYPKFIVSSIPLVPDFSGLGSNWKDKWGRFSEQRKRILDLISREDKIVFLSGDVHVSYVAAMYRDGESQPFSHNIVSSALNWPMIGYQRFHFRWGKRLKNTYDDDPKLGDFSGISARLLGPNEHDEEDEIDDGFESIFDIEKRNCYAIVTAEPNKVTVEYFRGRNGKKAGNTMTLSL